MTEGRDLSKDEDAQIREYIARHLDAMAAYAAEYGNHTMVEAATAARTAWQEHGRLEGSTPRALFVAAEQDALRTGQEFLKGRGSHEALEQARQRVTTVGLWLIAHGYHTGVE